MSQNKVAGFVDLLNTTPVSLHRATVYRLHQRFLTDPETALSDGRWVFYVNVPFMLIALLLLIVKMPALRQPRTRLRIDSLGVLLLVCGTVPLLLGLSWAGSQYPWGAWQVWGLIGGGLIAMMLFFVNEARLERCNAEPIIEPGLFQNHVFSISLVVLSRWL